MMNNQEFETLVTKAIDNAPSWLKEDLENILKKSEPLVRVSYVVSELYSRYTFGIRHITSSMSKSSEWSLVAHERLNFIDNNIDLIQHMLKRMKK